MGVYLATPITDKKSEAGGDFESTACRYGVSEMQGWRQHMEDAHLAAPSVKSSASHEGMGVDSMSLFGVFDGHGGVTVSKWTEKNFESVFARQLVDVGRRVAQGELAGRQTQGIPLNTVIVCEALQQAFMAIDIEMQTAENRGRLKEIYREIESTSQGEENKSSFLDSLMKHPDSSIRLVKKDGQSCLVSSPDDDDDDDEEEDELSEGKDDGDGLVDGGSRRVMKLTDRARSVEDMTGKESNEGSDMHGNIGYEEELEEDEDEGGMDQNTNWQPECCGATAVITAVIRGEKPMLITANAGDSRGVLSRGGTAVALSEDHKPTLLNEEIRIKKAGGSVANGRIDGNLNLSRSLGDLIYKKDANLLAEAQKITAFPDVRVTPITPQDEFCLLACDGIWDCMTNERAVAYCRSAMVAHHKQHGTEPDLAAICEELCDACLSKNPLETEGIGCDNMTAMIVQLIPMSQFASDPEKAIEALTASNDVVLYRAGQPTFSADEQPTSTTLVCTEEAQSIHKATYVHADRVMLNYY